jgi:hypothetical protein
MIIIQVQYIDPSNGKIYKNILLHSKPSTINEGNYLLNRIKIESVLLRTMNSLGPSMDNYFRKKASNIYHYQGIKVKFLCSKKEV